MTAKIEKDFTFETAVHIEDKFFINSYWMTVRMLVNTESQHEQNIAIERLNYFIAECVENSVFVNSKDDKAIEKYTNADIKVLTLPEDPFDQIVGIVLMAKLNAILEDKLYITDITFFSKLTAGIKFHSPAEETEEFAGKHWWNDPTLTTKEPKSSRKKDKIVKLFDSDDWAETGLIWKAKAD